MFGAAMSAADWHTFIAGLLARLDAAQSYVDETEKTSLHLNTCWKHLYWFLRNRPSKENPASTEAKNRASQLVDFLSKEELAAILAGECLVLSTT